MEQHNNQRRYIADRGCKTHAEHTAVNHERVDKVARDIEHRHDDNRDNNTVCVAVEPHQRVELKQEQHAREREHDTEKIIRGGLEQI